MTLIYTKLKSSGFSFGLSFCYVHIYSLYVYWTKGRDRDLHGVAAAMVKLWEKSEIAKIGFKRGILNTNQERISEDLKVLFVIILLQLVTVNSFFFD
jgi:hypothetical protein